MVKYVIPASNREKSLIAITTKNAEVVLVDQNYIVNSQEPISAFAGFEHKEEPSHESDPLDDIIKEKTGSARGGYRGRGKR